MAVRRNLAGGSRPGQASRPLVGGIEPATAYLSENPDVLDAIYDGDLAGYTYAREGHPNADRLAAIIDGLEGTARGRIIGSGMAAISAVLLGLTKAGDHVIGGDQLYGRSLRLLNEELPRLGVQTTLVDPTSAAAVAAAIRPQTRLIVIEAVSNPALRVADVAAIARLSAERQILLAIDNTFTTPRAFRPLDHGTDIVIHSVTKLLAGHSDVTLGYVAARDPGVADRLGDVVSSFGLTPSPFDCWLAERGLYSFHLRYDRAAQNAAMLADALAEIGGVTRVIYPGRADHPDHRRAKSLFAENFGTMVSFEITGGRAAANRLVGAAPGLAFAPTLGDVTTTLSHPASSSHRALSPDARAALGLSEGFFRVSVGVENADDLINELCAAVQSACG